MKWIFPSALTSANDGISNEELVITQVCWMIETKGVEFMLRADAMLLHTRSKLRFLFVGDGPELPRYREIAIELGIDGAVTITGLLSNPTEVGVFDASDIYYQPSLWQEASGLAVLEAMSVKLPVIPSNTGGLPVGDSSACGRESGDLCGAGTASGRCGSPPEHGRHRLPVDSQRASD
jgi:glycosyltransferase involved in cell wall biosynthesis